MGDLQDLQQMVIAFRDARNWQQFHNPKDMTISLVLEATELLEHFQWKSATEMNQHIKDHKTDVSDELADVLYWILLLANDLSIDLVAALNAKMAQNEAKYPVDKAGGNHKKYTEL